MTDKISDMITRIRNGYLASKAEVSLPHTNLLEKIAQVLVTEKYLAGSSVTESEDGKKTLKLTLNYSGHTPAISTIKRVSKPGVRIYTPVSGLKPVLSGLGLAILSTSHGVMTDRAAKQQKIGGEVLFELW